MDYFLSIENTSYHRWQTELLIESFKKHEMEDNLVIAIADTLSYDANYTKNIEKHTRKFGHIDCKEKNKVLSIIHAITNKLIAQPFIMLPPSALLMHPYIAEDDCNIVIDAQLWDMPATTPELKEQIKTILGKDEIIHATDIMKFQTVPTMFFYRVLHWINTYPDINPWTLALCEYKGLIKYSLVRYSLAMVEDQQNANFINYRRGMPPNFIPQSYTFQQFSIANDPYNTIREYDINTTTNYMTKILDSYQSFIDSTLASGEVT